MADDEKQAEQTPQQNDEALVLSKQVEQARQALLQGDIDTSPMQRILALDVIGSLRAWFSVHVVAPYVAPRQKTLIHRPDSLPDRPDDAEFVYPIIDTGDILATSKATEMFSVGYSMCKLHYTIEKMIWLLNESLQQDDSGKGGLVDPDTEIQLAIHGHPSALRFAFSSVINLPGNVVIINYDPGNWGDAYLATINLWAEKGYGYPPESPRDVFKKAHGSPNPKS